MAAAFSNCLMGDLRVVAAFSNCLKEIFEWSLLSADESVLFVVSKFEVSAQATTGLQDSCWILLTRIISCVFKLSPAGPSIHNDLDVEYQRISSPFLVWYCLQIKLSEQSLSMRFV